MVQGKELEAPVHIVQIIQTQAKTINDLSKLNDQLITRMNSLLEKFVNYDLQKIKQYDEFNKYLLQQKNIEQGIMPPVQQNKDNNPLEDIINKMFNLRQKERSVSTVHPDFQTNESITIPDWGDQIKSMQQEIERLKKMQGNSDESPRSS